MSFSKTIDWANGLSSLTGISVLCTLGPVGTNCEAAASSWFGDREGEIRLFSTLEEAIPMVRSDPHFALMACAAYPRIHEIVFRNLVWLDMVDSILMPTYPMVLARRAGVELRTVSTHAAPQDLVPIEMRRRLVDSNSQAAEDCAHGLSDGCIATLPAARAHGLEIVQNFGPVGMAFTVHAHRSLIGGKERS